MKPKKPQKTKPPLRTKRPSKPARPSAPPVTNTTIVTAPPPAPKTPRQARPRLTEGERLASSLIRFCRIHAKNAYQKRGMRALLDLEARVQQAAQRESRTVADLYRGNFSFVDESLRQVRESLASPSEPTTEAVN